MTAVRLNVEWVRPLFGLDPADHLDVERALSDVLPTLNRALLPSLMRATSEPEIVRILMRGIEDRLAAASPRQDVRQALTLVRASRGLAQVESVARACDLSVRHLRRVVRAETGMSLKAYARNVRFLHAVTLADQTRDPNWAEIAIRTGYCDQSHLIRDAQAFAGATPERIHRERRAER